MSLSLPEIALIAGLRGLMGFECLKSVRSGSWVQVYRPTLFVAVFLSFYALVGPLRAILAHGEAANFVGTSGTIYRDIDHRSFLVWGWLGAFLFYGFLLLGFYIQSPSLRPIRTTSRASLARISFFGTLLCWIGALSFFLLKLEALLFASSAPLGSIQSISLLNWVSNSFLLNYLSLSANFLVPGVVLQYSAWLRQRKNLYGVVAWFLIASSIFLVDGFRYRLLLLVFPLILLWLFYSKKKPRLILLILFMVAFVGLNGAYSVARHISRHNPEANQYESIVRFNPLEMFGSSFEEAGVFFTTSAVIRSLPEQTNFVGWAPLFNALLQPVPRDLFRQKPSGEYSSKIREKIYNSPVSFTAYLNYAEYYIAFGWTGVIALSILFGFLLRRLWTWFLWRQYEPLAQAVYLLNSSYLYVVISRGYVAQVVMLYCLTVMPIMILYYFLSDRV